MLVGEEVILKQRRDMQRSGKAGRLKTELKAGGNIDTSNICNYCHGERPLDGRLCFLKAKNKGRKVSVKPAAFAAPVKDCCVSEVFTPHTCEPVFVLFGKLLLLSFEKGLCLSWEVM